MKIWTNSACPHSYFILWRFHLHLRELHIRIDRVCAFDDCKKFMRNPFKKWEFHCQFHWHMLQSFVRLILVNEKWALRCVRADRRRLVAEGIVSETGEFSAFIHAIYGRRRLIQMAAEQLVNRQARASSIHNSQRKCVIQSATNSLGFSRSTTRKYIW